MELGDANDLLDTLGQMLFGDIRDEFYRRLRTWGRTGDEAVALDNNRFSVVLNGVSNGAELELAASKLGRLFELPFELHYQPKFHAPYRTLVGAEALARTVNSIDSQRNLQNNRGLR